MTFDLFMLDLGSTGMQLRTLEEYVARTSAFLDEKKTNFEQYLREAEKGLSSEDMAELVDYHYDEIKHHWKGFPSVLHGSALVSACSCLETGFMQLCKNLQGQKSVQGHGEHKDAFNLTRRWEEIERHQNGVRRAKLFLCENFGLEISKHSSWEQIDDYYQIRNSVVHAGGGDLRLLDDALAKGSIEALELDERRAKKLIKTLESDTIRQKNLIETIDRCKEYGVARTESGELQIEGRFVKHVVRDMAAFWSALEDALEANEFIGGFYWP